MNWYLKSLKQYADFNGRARRKEYWMFMLIHIAIAVILLIISSFIESLISLFFLYILATLLPAFAVSVRRLHDIGKSGWMLLVRFIPFVGDIWLIILLSTEGENSDNQYGQDPKNPFDEIDEIGNN